MADHAATARRPAAVWRRLTEPARRGWRWFAHAPRVLQAGVVAVLVAAVAVGGVFAGSYLARRAKLKEVAAGWQEYAEAAKKPDLPAMAAALDRVLAANPADEAAGRRKDDLERGAADPADVELAVIFRDHHVAANRLAEAAAEAHKVLAQFPKDWRSRCVAAHDALARNDAAAARAHLDALPHPEDPQARWDLGGMLYAMMLYGQTGRDAADLRATIVRRLLPAMRGTAAATAAPVVKAQLLECYLEAFADPGNLQELSAYWAAADRLADQAVTEAADAADVTALVRLGTLGRRTAVALARIREHERTPDDRYAPLAKAVADRNARAWRAVREKDPALVDGYRGLAEALLHEGKVGEAIDLLTDGLVATNDRADLLHFLTQLVVRFDPSRIEEFRRATWAAAEKAETDPGKWATAVTAAVAARRRDLAIEACRRGRRHAPGHPWLVHNEAALALDAGDATAALEALAQLPPGKLAAEPGPAYLRARALAEAGAGALLPAFFAEVDAAAEAAKPPSPAVPAMAARGLFDADPPTADRAAQVADRAEALLRRWPNDPAAVRLRADALARLADLTAPPWNPDRVRAALRAHAALSADQKADPRAAAAVALLHLKGLGEADTALRAAAPLRAAEDDPALPPALLEPLGAVYVGAGRWDDAVRVLSRAVRGPRPSAGAWVSLALAYRGRGQRPEARAALQEALTVPRSPREQAEWSAANQLISRESP